MNEATLRVRIVSPQRVILDTQAVSVTSTNSQGTFDILPQHANFITLVENSPIVVRMPDKKHLSFGFPLAIILTTGNTVNVYTYITYLAKAGAATAFQQLPPSMLNQVKETK